MSDLLDYITHAALKEDATPEDLASWHEALMGIGLSEILGYTPIERTDDLAGVAVAVLETIGEVQVSLSLLASTILAKLLKT